MTKILQFLNASDVIDICCPSTSRATVDSEETSQKLEIEDDDHNQLLEGDDSPFIIVPQHNANKFAELNSKGSASAVMTHLTQVQEDLKKVKMLSSNDKAQINNMLILIRVEVSNKMNTNKAQVNRGSTPKSKSFLHLKTHLSSKFRKKTADV